MHVWLSRRTQFQYVQKAIMADGSIRKPKVERLDGNDGSAESFEVTVQEPSVAGLLSALSRLEADYGFEAPATLHLLEVSVDFKPKMPSDQARAQMLGVLFRSVLPTWDIWTDWDHQPRFAFGAGKVNMKHIFMQKGHKVREDSYLTPDRTKAVPVDATLYLGKEHGPCMIRVMDKVIDRQTIPGEVFEALPDERKRARIEVTLMGDQLRRLKLERVSDLEAFSFSGLQGDFFRFMHPTFRDVSEGPHLDPLSERIERTRRDLFLCAGIIGLAYYEARRREERAGPNKILNQTLRALGKATRRHRTQGGIQESFAAYVELNDIVRGALRNLANRERRAASKIA